MLTYRRPTAEDRARILAAMAEMGHTADSAAVGQGHSSVEAMVMLGHFADTLRSWGLSYDLIAQAGNDLASDAAQARSDEELWTLFDTACAYVAECLASPRAGDRLVRAAHGPVEESALLRNSIAAIRSTIDDQGFYPWLFACAEHGGRTNIYAVALSNGNEVLRFASRTIRDLRPVEWVLAIDMHAAPGQGLLYADFVLLVWCRAGVYRVAVVDYQRPAVGSGFRVNWENEHWVEQCEAHFLPPLALAALAPLRGYTAATS